MNNPFSIKELQLQDLKNLNLIDSDDNYTIEREEVDALLAGRMTNLVSLKNLHANGSQIDQLDAKLSLFRGEDGKVSIRLHPIYKEPLVPELLTEDEARSLINGRVATVVKNVPGTGKNELVFEYDKDTRAFVHYEPVKVIVPDKVNGYQLKDWQKEDFQKGNKVELPDGTALQHRATDPKGILADRAALVLSVLIDGGISYLLLRGIRHLVNNHKPQEDYNTPAFQKAYAEMERHFANKAKPVDHANEESHNYMHTRAR